MVSAGRINLYLYENRRAACEAVPDADADAAQALARRYRRRQRAAFVLRATMFAPIDSCSIARCRRRRRCRCRQRCSASVAAHSANVN